MASVQARVAVPRSMSASLPSASLCVIAWWAGTAQNRSSQMALISDSMAGRNLPWSSMHSATAKATSRVVRNW